MSCVKLEHTLILIFSFEQGQLQKWETHLCICMDCIWVGVINDDQVLSARRNQLNRSGVLTNAEHLMSRMHAPGDVSSRLLAPLYHRAAGLFQYRRTRRADQHELLRGRSGSVRQRKGFDSLHETQAAFDGPLNATGRSCRPRWTAASAVAKPIFPVTPFTMTVCEGPAIAG
jgi:hypothetical protein